MVVVMRPDATPEDIDAIVARVAAAGGEAFVSRGVQRTIVGLVGDIAHFTTLNLRAMKGVGDVVRVSKPYKLVSREHHPEATTIQVGGVPIGPDTFTLIAGPCAVETAEQTLEAAGGQAFVSRGVVRTIVGLVGDIDVFQGLELRAMPGVADVHRISVPYKLVSREHHPDRSVVWVGRGDRRVAIGPSTFTFIAGPCAVESADQTAKAAQMAVAAGAQLLRGGAFKPRTSPYAFQGLGSSGLRILAEVGEAVGLPVVTEVVDAVDVDEVAEHADMLQVGTRNMQYFGLLQAVGRTGKPVLL